MATLEIKSFTGLRGVASLYVVILHYYQYIEYYLKHNGGSKLNEHLTAFCMHGYLAVDVFFILSAFVITLSSKKYFDKSFEFSNYKMFMQKRWIRIYPAYIIIAIYGYVIVENFSRTPNFILSLTLLNLLFGLSHILGHLWSLSAEWITYLLYPVFYKFSMLKESKYWKYVLVSLGLIVLYLVGLVWNKRIFADYMLEVFQGYPSLFRCFGDYLIGMGAYLAYRENKYNKLTSHLSSIVISVLILIALFVPKADLLVVLLCSILLLNICTDKSLVAKLLASKVIYFLGLISYPLYLINSLVFLEFDRIHVVLMDYFDLNNIYLLGIAFIAICVLLATIFTFYIESPIISFLNSRFKRPLETKLTHPGQ